MMQISNSYIAVSKYYEPEPEEGQFTTVKVQDESLFKGIVKFIPEVPVYLGNELVKIGDLVLFAKYSPDTHEIEHEGETLKFINTRDILAKL